MNLGPDLDAVEGRLGDVDVAVLDQRLQVTEEKCEQEGPNVGAVDVGVGEQDDLVIAGLLDVELLADPGPHRSDDVLHLEVLQGLGQPGLLHVEDLAPDGEDRLGVGVTGRLGGAGGGLALDDEQLGLSRVPG